MDIFWMLLAKSVIISGTLAVTLTWVVAYLAVTGREIPDILAQALIAIIAFFFGQRQEMLAQWSKELLEYKAELRAKDELRVKEAKDDVPDIRNPAAR